MKRFSLKDASVAELVTRFEAIARAQDDALLSFRTATYNKLYRSMDAVRQELKSRSGDQRRALAPLLVSDNTQVRLKTAITLLSIFPTQARGALNTISQDKLAPQCADAGGILRGIDDGSFVPY